MGWLLARYSANPAFQLVDNHLACAPYRVLYVGVSACAVGPDYFVFSLNQFVVIVVVGFKGSLKFDGGIAVILVTAKFEDVVAAT